MKTRQGVREALLNLGGVLDVLIDDGKAVFQMRPGATLDASAAREVLEEKNVAAKGDRAATGFRFRAETKED